MPRSVRADIGPMESLCTPKDRTATLSLGSTTTRRVGASQSLRRAALSAAFVLGLAACGGGDTGDLATGDATTDSTFMTDFVAASPSDTEDQPAEALALVDEEESGQEVAEEAPAEEVAGEGSESTTAVPADSPASPPGAEGNHSVLSNGQIYLRGTVPNQEVHDLTVQAFEEVLGEGNVFPEYEIDPAADFDPEEVQSIFLADAVLFETDSAEIGEDFEDVLSFSPLLLAAQPNVTLWAFGHTDSVGDAESNLRLSQERVDAVRDWVIENGGDPERIFASGEGEENPIADNSTAEGRAMNRRVEFTIASFDIGLDG